MPYCADRLLGKHSTDLTLVSLWPAGVSSFWGRYVWDNEDMQTARVVIDYTNYKGERAERLITPQGIHFGSNRWHPEEQWLLRAIDTVKGQERTFAFKDIHSWRPATAEDEPAACTCGHSFGAHNHMGCYGPRCACREYVAASRVEQPV